MDSSELSDHHPPRPPSVGNPPPRPPPTKPDNDRDFLRHLESYLAKRDGVDKLLKITRYATKIILSSSLLLPETLTLTRRRLKSFESSVGVSRKAFRLGKFVQDINALRRTADSSSPLPILLLSIIAYGGEGVYFFVEQFVWMVKAGLIDSGYSKVLQRISVWAELIGYFGSVWLKLVEIRRLREQEREALGEEAEKEKEKGRMLMRKIVMKEVSVVQDLADGYMALADIRDGNERVFAPVLVAGAGLLSALISAHKNWVSC